MLRQIQTEEINTQLFDGFRRYQDVRRCWRKIDNQWEIVDISFTEDWDQAQYAELASGLRRTIEDGGAVFGVFEGNRLRGFASVEAQPMGSQGQYLELSGIHVSQESRGCGVGRRLFAAARAWAADHGARKLYISAHSSVESQAFYRAMGCREAQEYSPLHVEKEPYDCQLEADVI